MSVPERGGMGKTEETKQAAPGVYICSDGKMRWAYDYNAWASPDRFLKLVRILLCVTVMAAAVCFLLTVSSGFKQSGIFALQVLGYGAAASLVLSAAGWAASASSGGGKYCVVFEMDEKGVNRVDMRSEYKRTEALAMLGVVEQDGPGTAPLGVMAASKKSLYSEFRRVRCLRVRRKSHTIVMEARRAPNEIYAGREQFDFVLDYIRAHCKPDVKVK